VSDPLEPFARRAEGDPFFLASLLAVYAAGEGLDDEALAQHLGCPTAVLVDVRLCRAPAEEARDFRRDIDSIAGHFGLDRDRLAGVVRRAQALLALRSAAAGAPGTLLAAREDEPKEEEP
jgi:hypothetical protein